MSIEMEFSPAELADMLNVSKSTLFRWEKDGVLPPTERNITNMRNERMYTQEHVAKIVEAQKPELSRQIKQAQNAAEQHSSVGQGTLGRLLEANSLRKFLAGQELGLRELAVYESLDARTIQILLRVALQQTPPDSPLFARITRIVADQSAKLAKRRA